jgi:hypothetical protein
VGATLGMYGWKVDIQVVVRIYFFYFRVKVVSGDFCCELILYRLGHSDGFWVCLFA